MMNYNQYQYPYNSYQHVQQQQQQTIYHPLTFVSGLVGAQAFIVPPGQTMYLMDMQGKMLYIKTSDNQGRYNLQSFSLSDTTAKPTPEYVTPRDLESFNIRLTKLEEMMINAKQSNSNVNANPTNGQ